MSAAKMFWLGVRDEFPLLVGVFPFGMIYGVLALAAGLPPSAAQAMSSIVFAGSSQFVAVQLISQGAPLVVIVLTIAVVNLRHALYSASLAEHVQHLPGRWRALLAYLLTDEAYAVSVVHYERAPTVESHWYFFGAGLALWSVWQLSSAVGIWLGAAVPPAWSLDFTLSLTFIALLIPLLRDRPGALAAGVAALTALLAYDLPFKLGLVAAALAGILAGLLSENWLQKRGQPAGAQPE